VSPNPYREPQQKTSGLLVALVAGGLIALIAANIYLYLQVDHLREEVAKVSVTLSTELGSLRDASTVTTASQARHLEKMKEDLEAARAQARDQARSLSSQAKAEAQAHADQLARQIQAEEAKVQQQVNSEISEVKTSANTANAKIADVSTDVGGVKTQVSATQAELQKTIADLKSTRGDLGVQSGLIATNSGELAALRKLGELDPAELVATNALTKNPTYWQASKIVPQQVLFPAQASNQSTNQLDVSSGKFDWAYNFLPNVKTTYVARDPQHNIYWFPPGGTIGLYLNLTKAPYNDVNFRTGISLSLDRTTIADKAVNGYLGQASMSGLILPNLQKWLDPSLPNQGLVTQNTSSAKAAFAKAGYTMQSGKLVGKDGKQASMTIVVPTNFTDWVAAATEVTNELKSVGINATTDLPQYAQYASQTQSGSFNAAMGGFGGAGVPYTDFNNALNSSFAVPVGTPTVNNFERFKSASVDKSLAQLAAATDAATQQAATNQLQQEMYTQTPIVLLYYGGSWGLFSTKNFTGWPSAADPYALPTSYNNAVLMVLTHLKKS